MARGRTAVYIESMLEKPRLPGSHRRQAAIALIASAAIPGERARLGIAAMRHRTS